MSEFKDPEDEYDEEFIKEILNQRLEIKEPISNDDVQNMIQQWEVMENLGKVEIETERYHLGCDELGYINIANLTSKKNNPMESFYTIKRDEQFKRNKRMQYSIEFFTIGLDVDDDDYSDDEVEIYTIGFCMNLFDVIRLIAKHYKTHLKHK